MFWLGVQPGHTMQQPTRSHNAAANQVTQYSSQPGHTIQQPTRSHNAAEQRNLQSGMGETATHNSLSKDGEVNMQEHEHRKPNAYVINCQCNPVATVTAVNFRIKRILHCIVLFSKRFHHVQTNHMDKKQQPQIQLAFWLNWVFTPHYYTQ